MNKFIPREIAVDVGRIVDIGSSGQFAALDSGAIVKLNEVCRVKHTPEIGDVIVSNGVYRLLMSESQFDQTHHIPDLKPHLDSVEDLISTFEFINRGPLTLCVLNLKSGQVISGECVRYVESMCSQEEAENIAYGNALAALMRFEAYMVQRQVNKVT